MPDIFISGVPFIALGHRDGGFARAPGLFAFSRRDLNGVHTVLHFEMAALISQRAAPSHPRWAWALREGMDSLLIHMFGRPAAAPERRWCLSLKLRGWTSSNGPVEAGSLSSSPIW